MPSPHNSVSNTKATASRRQAAMPPSTGANWWLSPGSSPSPWFAALIDALDATEGVSAGDEAERACDGPCDGGAPVGSCADSVTSSVLLMVSFVSGTVQALLGEGQQV